MESRYIPMLIRNLPIHVCVKKAYTVIALIKVIVWGPGFEAHLTIPGTGGMAGYVIAALDVMVTLSRDFL